MSLKIISIRDLDDGSGTFIDRLQANSPNGAGGGIDGDDSFHILLNNRGKQFYHDRTDEYWMKMEGTGAVWARMDPLLVALDYGPSTLNEVFGPDVKSGGPAQDIYFVGENDPDLGVQRVYGIDTFGANLVREVSLVTPFTTAVPDFAADNFRAAGISSRQSAGAAGVQGARPAQTGQMLFFESAEPATWPSGYALGIDMKIFDDADAGLLEYERCLVQIDLADEGGSTGPPGGLGRAQVVPTAAWYSSAPSPLHPTAHAGPLGGFNVLFDHLQFAPDPDSTITAPKGRLFLFNLDNGTSNEHRVPIGTPSVGDVFHKFIKVVEWNPTAKAPTTGNVNRVHLRQQLLSIMKFIEETAINGIVGGFGLGNPAAKGADYIFPFFHPPSGTLRCVVNTGTSSGNDGDSTEIVFSLAPAVDAITVPTQIGQAETGKTVRFRSEALGDIGEKISGVDLDWALTRRSTVGEAVTNPGPAGTFTVANVPIDGTDAVPSITVFEDGTPLDLTTHYTVDVSTGEVTGVGAKFVALTAITVDYDHHQTGASPPLGLLRTQRSRTDSLGRAFATVEVPDDDTIAGEYDGLSSVEAP